MIILMKRIFTLVSLSAGLVLFLAPFNTYERKYVNQEFVFISAHMEKASDLYTLMDSQVNSFPDLKELLLSRSHWFKNISYSDIAELNEQTKQRPNPYGLLALSTQQNRWKREGTNLSPDKWRKMSIELFGFSNNHISFEWRSLVFEVTIKMNDQFANIPIPGLEKYRKLTGALLFVTALINYLTLIIKPQGIPVGRPGIIMLWDVIVVLFNLVFIHAAIDLLFHKIFNCLPYWDFYLHFMGAFINLAGIPAVSLFISLTASQSIQVTEEEIISKGLFRKKTMAWKSIISIKLSDYYSVKQVQGMTAPKHLTQVLVIQGDQNSLTIMDPPLRSSKQAIMQALENHAPSYLKEKINELAIKW